MELKLFRFILFSLLSSILSCGTVYVPQILPEGRGISRSEGQEKISIEVIPLTLKVIKLANEDDYERRIIDAGDLNRAARLISIDQAIGEKLPKNNDPGQYKLGIGDKLNISQILSVQDQTGFTQKIAQRELSIADDGFASVLGIGRIPLAGLSQFEAEDLLYKRLVLEEINPEFEIFISDFNSKKINVINLLPSLNEGEKNNSNLFEFPYTNNPIYINQILAKSKVILKKGEDALVILKRANEQYRMSLLNIIEGKYKKIRLFPDDQIIIKSLPYRPETAIIIGEVLKPRLYELTASDRKTLSEVLYSDDTFDNVTSDTSQIYLMRPKSSKKVIAYHLDASNPSRLVLANKFELRPGDIVYVAPQPVTNYNRALIQIFGAYAMTTNPQLTSN